MKDRLMAVEVWFLRRMLKISWMEKKSNEEVFQEAGAHRTLLKSIRQRQLAFLGHVLRRQSLENLVVTERIDGRRARGRQRLKHLDSLCDSLKDKVSATQLIRASEDRGLWQCMANVTTHLSKLSENCGLFLLDMVYFQHGHYYKVDKVSTRK